jgi:hypothetical protein
MSKRGQVWIDEGEHTVPAGDVHGRHEDAYEEVGLVNQVGV